MNEDFFLQLDTQLAKYHLISFTRNFRQTCQQLPGLDLSAWQSDEEPEYTTESEDVEETATSTIEEINEDLIKSAIEKAKADLIERAKFEYKVWLNGKLNSI